jgi:hypothetical protein
MKFFSKFFAKDFSLALALVLPAFAALLAGAAPNGSVSDTPHPSVTGPASSVTEPQTSGDLALRVNYTISHDVLTTEKVWVLDADEPNPHRQRWVLNRKVNLVDLKPREIRGAKAAVAYGVTAGGLDVSSTAYFRGEGPWYHPLTDFPCSKEPLSWFGTPQGAQVATDMAAKTWDELLEAERIKLSVLLKRIAGASPGMALEKGRLIFEEWLKETDTAWRAKGRVEAKRAEWLYYLSTARESGICDAAGSRRAGIKTPEAPVAEDEYVPPPAQGPVPWELMMEHPGTGEIGRAGSMFDETKLLARAPAKLWDGLFSVRLNLTVAGRKLNGSFLIDSGTGTSVISPDFLTEQGILSAWIEVPGAPFRRVPWGGGEKTGSQGGLAPVVSFDLAELGNTPLQLRDFALFDSEFFSPPENPASCCDGVLGTDFLRHYVVELQPGPPAEVKLWPPENFHLAPDDGAASDRVSAQWVETALGPQGDAVSACTARLEDPRKSASKSLRLVGVRWDTGREDALDLHVPWQKAARAASSDASGWEISCGPSLSETIAHRVPASFPKPDGSPESAALQTQVPAFTVGMELLGRGRVFLDFPHGRIWFPDKTSDEPILRDHSGLVAQYEFTQGKVETRALVVKAIRAGSPAQVLSKRGLKPGMFITQVDKIDVDELDARQVSRHLAGVFGPQVYVQWKTPQGLKLGVVQVR